MKPRQFSHSLLVSLAALCLLLAPVAGAEDTTFEDGPAGFYKESEENTEPWQELSADLPAWPGKIDRLIRLNVSTGGLPYRIYLDPASLASGDDRVVRFTTVLISSSGVWNVTYEGLHCGERKYRRFAYGIDGEWYPLKDSPWQRISGTGVNQYRKLLYEEYLCDVAKEYQDADELVRKLRYRNPGIIED